MLPVKRQGKGLPALIFMPFTGGSWREYSRTIPSLEEKHECIGLYLPGYGVARDVAGYTVQELAENVADTVASMGLERFVLVGHSYSGRVAAVVARFAADGDVRLKGLSGLVLIAPATFSPDPLPDDVRAQLLEMFESPPAIDDQGKQKDRQTAEQFILMNVAHTLPADVLATATEDVLLMNRAAWKSWYGDESKKDWSERIGVLQLPVLIVAGEKDPSVGPSVQEKPLLIAHGWPYSFHSYGGLVDRLAHPERHGGRIDDAFSVVIPSYPGYDFSSRPHKPMGPHAIALLFDTLMARLGYDRYVVHGGDWGAHITSLLGLHRPERVMGIHSTALALREAGAEQLSGKTPIDATEEERSFVAAEYAIWQREGAYSQLQATKPAKLAYAMLDSPVGTAAWIVEAFHAWADLKDRSFERVFSFD